MIEDKYVTSLPSNQNAVDCFKGNWYSKFPDYLNVNGGDARLFDDVRIAKSLTHLGNIDEWDVVELGPLEGAHATYFESNTNVRTITAIESNRLCWIKCLITKELVRLTKTQFLLGDLTKYLKNCNKSFDLGLCLGILYHQENPFEVIQLLSSCCRNVIIWTQYANEMQNKWPRTELRHDGFAGDAFINNYGEGRNLKNFIGGVKERAFWFSKNTYTECFQYYGFKDIIVISNGENEHGGEITFVARK